MNIDLNHFFLIAFERKLSVFHSEKRSKIIIVELSLQFEALTFNCFHRTKLKASHSPQRKFELNYFCENCRKPSKLLQLLSGRNYFYNKAPENFKLSWLTVFVLRTLTELVRSWKLTGNFSGDVDDLYWKCCVLGRNEHSQSSFFFFEFSLAKESNLSRLLQRDKNRWRRHVRKRFFSFRYFLAKLLNLVIFRYLYELHPSSNKQTS